MYTIPLISMYVYMKWCYLRINEKLKRFLLKMMIFFWNYLTSIKPSPSVMRVLFLLHKCRSTQTQCGPLARRSESSVGVRCKSIKRQCEKENKRKMTLTSFVTFALMLLSRDSRALSISLEFVHQKLPSNCALAALNRHTEQNIHSKFILNYFSNWNWKTISVGKIHQS